MAGIRWRYLGIAAAGGAVVYFIGAIVSHLRVGDLAGTPGAAFMLPIAAVMLARRVRARARPRSTVHERADAAGSH